MTAPAFNVGMAHALDTKSPLHAWHGNRHLNPDFQEKQRREFDIGRAAHKLILEGVTPDQSERFAIIDAPDFRTKAAREARDEAYASDRIPMLAKDTAMLDAMVSAVRSKHGDLFSNGKAEMLHEWDYGGIACRSRVDWQPDEPTRPLIDLKTCESANPEAWCRTTLWRTAAWAEAVAYPLAAGNAGLVFLLIEKSAPHATALVSLSQAALDLAQEKWDAAAWSWRHCLESGEWPGYDGIHVHEPPKWMLYQEGLE